MYNGTAGNVEKNSGEKGLLGFASEQKDPSCTASCHEDVPEMGTRRPGMLLERSRKPGKPDLSDLLWFLALRNEQMDEAV